MICDLMKSINKRKQRNFGNQCVCRDINFFLIVDFEFFFVCSRSSKPNQSIVYVKRLLDQIYCDKEKKTKYILLIAMFLFDTKQKTNGDRRRLFYFYIFGLLTVMLSVSCSIANGLIM